MNPLVRAEDIQAFINDLCDGKKNLCLFGAGLLSRTRTRWYLNYFNIKPSYLCDNNSSLWHSELYGIPCISPDELLRIKDEVYVIVSVGYPHRAEVAKQLMGMGITKYIYSHDLNIMFENDEFLASWIGVDRIEKYQKPVEPVKPQYVGKTYSKGNKIAVYTCIAGHYDLPLTPACYPDQIDYYLITDSYDEAPGYRVLDLNKIAPPDIVRSDGPLLNRYCKFNANKIFQDYRYSIYFDGCCRITQDISDYIDYISEVGFTTFKNPINPDAYVEGFVIGTLGDYDEIMPQLKKQLKKYALEGYPRTPFGLQGTFIARDHDNLLADEIMEDWYREFKNGVRRDQLSATYVMWKHQVDFDRYVCLPEKRLFRDWESVLHTEEKEKFKLEN